jgi:WhiB family redox-sensing transcriptional regulator
VGLVNRRDDWREEASCVGQTELYFSENAGDVYACRAICADCPVFDECKTYYLSHPDEQGIAFGLTEVERRAIISGVMSFTDWRNTDWSHPMTSRRLGALEREALRRGVPAVWAVSEGRLYEMSMEERQEAILAYQQWRSEQLFPATYHEAVARIEKLNSRVAKIQSTRPACPQGCSGEHMTRIRTNAKGEKVWRCYRCGSKVALTPEEDARYGERAAS